MTRDYVCNLVVPMFEAMKKYHNKENYKDNLFFITILNEQSLTKLDRIHFKNNSRYRIQPYVQCNGYTTPQSYSLEFGCHNTLISIN